MYVTDYKMLYIYYISVKTPIKKKYKISKGLKSFFTTFTIIKTLMIYNYCPLEQEICHTTLNNSFIFIFSKLIF